ncbi:hypothetical protein LAZ67_13002742 [Cordylochernes scorpioides]|uniref:Uncharacterized protein n=1 Tax=Cordylochernes scorpioides TaxID=51811 RepID=A0ABY6L4R3_9ARAC|nr:hypothetical protein LAZ67_13002742 [Cordylochernes scorpioides]
MLEYCESRRYNDREAGSPGNRRWLEDGVVAEAGRLLHKSDINCVLPKEVAHLHTSSENGNAAHIEVCHAEAHDILLPAAALVEEKTPCAATPNMEFQMLLILYSWIRSPYRVLSAGPAEPRFFSELVTAPPPPFASGLGTGKGGVSFYSEKRE